ncbi:MAG: glutathione S-transferase [Pseudoruegeria sp.]
MTYDVALADRAYSSWSLRGWLLFEKFGLPARYRFGRLYTDQFPSMLADFMPAKTVPVMRTPDGIVVPESLAIAEELHSRHPDAGLWPIDTKARAIARVLTTEMHAGFASLRNSCPMNLRVSYSNYSPDEAVQLDLRRLETLWDWARSEVPSEGPWLCGNYSVADAFFAPVAGRIAGYRLQLSTSAQAYVDAHLQDTSFRQWRAMALVDGPDQPTYKRDLETTQWPGPTPLAAVATCQDHAENDKCPYSGKPNTDYLDMNGRVFGFCNAFCRDKTAADPEAWPQFMDLHNS